MAAADELVALAYLRSPRAVRERAENVLRRGASGELEHFDVKLEALPATARFVVDVTREAHPTLDIPMHSRWNQFRAGGVDRVALLDRRLGELGRDERARVRFDLVVTSVLLDAGAGSAWRYVEAGGGSYARSEGLAVASFRLFESGAFSGRDGAPLRADASGLATLDRERLERGLQVSAQNPLVGVAGRVALLAALGQALGARPDLFGAEGRVGGLYDALRRRAADGRIAAREILGAVLEGLGGIWPGRLRLGGENLGDVWRHPAAGGEGPGAGLVPLHKLSQWLSYSLVEPLEQAGLSVTELDELTGLAEYRNGGLFVDAGVLVPKHAGVTAGRHAPGSELVVEWRALTVALLDRVADAVRAELGRDRQTLPLCRVLEGGTWAAGRRIAQRLRADGSSPIHVESDGTVF